MNDDDVWSFCIDPERQQRRTVLLKSNSWLSDIFLHEDPWSSTNRCQKYQPIIILYYTLYTRKIDSTIFLDIEDEVSYWFIDMFDIR